MSDTLIDFQTSETEVLLGSHCPTGRRYFDSVPTGTGNGENLEKWGSIFQPGNFTRTLEKYGK